MWVTGANPYLAYKIAATGGSVSPTNMSWDIFVQIGAYSGGIYHVDKASQAQWIPNGGFSADPGPASASVVVGNLQQIAANALFLGFATPSSSAATCTQGQFEFDAAYAYTCVATNTWRRTATAAF